MARKANDAQGFPLEEQLKILPEEQLLDFWEETQYLERFLEASQGARWELLAGPAQGGDPVGPSGQVVSASVGSGVDYEALILTELRCRLGQRLSGKDPQQG